ncbi:LysR substrate-binding domain-containing protein [Burkholderia sp. PU8-34]
MTLQQLRAFIAIVESGSLRRASRELGVSQAGLTSSLQALEATLGVVLLQRSSHGVVMTADGKRFLARAHLIDREARRAVEEAQQGRNGYDVTLHVGFGPTPTAVLLPLVVPDFHTRFPGVKLKLMSGFHEQMLPALQQGLIEVVVTALPDELTAPGLKTKSLFKSELVVVGRSGHPKANARALTDLVDCEWILLGSPGGPGGTVTRFYAEQGLPVPRIAATCESFTQVAALIAGTDWLALLPAVMVKRGLLGSQVVALHLQEASPKFDNCLVYRADPPLTPAASAFAAMCESCARIITGGQRTAVS